MTHPADPVTSPGAAGDGAEPAASIYRSSAMSEGVVPWRWVRRAAFDGVNCDRIGCYDATEARGRRFCAPHRAAHGARLLAGLDAVRAHHRAIDLAMSERAS